MSDDASVKVSVDGGDEVKKAFEQIAEASKKLAASVNQVGQAGESASGSAKKATSAWKSFTNDLKGEVTSSVKTVLTTVTALNTISFAQAIQQNREYQQSLARMSYGAGKSTADLRSNIRGVANATLEDERVTQAWAKSVGLVTGNYSQAIEMSKAYSAEALATGEDLADFTQTASNLSLSFGLKDASSVTKELETIRSMAQSVGTTGGPVALRQQIEALLGPSTQLAVATEEQRKKLEAWAAAIGKGYTPQQAGRVQQQLASFVEGNARGISRQLGHNVLDEQGHVQDLPKVVSEMRQVLQRKYGKNARSVATSLYGNEAAYAMFNFDQNSYEAALAAKPGDAGKQALEQYRRSDEGRQKSAQLRSDQARRDAAQALSPAMTAYQEFAANHPYASLALGLGGGGIGTTLLKHGAKALFRGALGAGSTGAAEGGGFSLASLLFGGLTGAATIPAAGLLGVGYVNSRKGAAYDKAQADYNAAHPVDAESAKYFGEGYAREHGATIRHGGMQVFNTPGTSSGPEDLLKVLQQSLTTNTDGVQSSIEKGFSNVKVNIPISIVTDKDGKIEAILQQNSKQ